jgi:phosphoglucosamine mutase
MARELFGTDGIRGQAGEFPLDPRTAHATGVALGHLAVRLAAQAGDATANSQAKPPAPPLGRSGNRDPVGQAFSLADAPEVVLGIDTRESSPWLAAQVAGGLARAGVRTRFAGLTTTPGVAWLARSSSCVAGVMISASHNQYRDNGIKILGHSGYKLPDEQERELEREILALVEAGVEPTPAELVEEPALDRGYLEFLASTLPEGLAGLRVVVDCANGAASHLAPDLFRRLGAEVTAIHCAPDGRNINRNCGSLHEHVVRQAVLEAEANLGIALDGDADRAILVSGTGKVVNGDAVLYLAAGFLHSRGLLPARDGGPVVVATVMSNLGLEEALNREGLRLLRTPVGDKYVLEAMLRCGAALGGEQSGHVIFRGYATTGDGLLTSLRVMEIMRATGKDLDQLTRGLKLYPQVLLNVPVRSRGPLELYPAVTAEIHAARAAFGEHGRILVRYSGTELLARVMVEGPDAAQVESAAQRIASAIQAATSV